MYGTGTSSKQRSSFHLCHGLFSFRVHSFQSGKESWIALPDCLSANSSAFAGYSRVSQQSCRLACDSLYYGPYHTYGIHFSASLMITCPVPRAQTRTTHLLSVRQFASLCSSCYDCGCCFLFYSCFSLSSTHTLSNRVIHLTYVIIDTNNEIARRDVDSHVRGSVCTRLCCGRCCSRPRRRQPRATLFPG